MPEMKPVTVWAVAEGEYSDYRVLAIFESEEDAKAAKDRGLGQSVEQLPFFLPGVEPVKVEQWIASAQLTKSPKYEYPRDGDPWVRPDHFWPAIDEGRAVVRRAKVEVHEWPSGEGWHIIVTSPSQKGALKACADRVAKLKSEYWIDPQPE